MTRTSIYFPPELHRELRDEARRSRTTQAELIPTAVVEFLRARRPVPSSIGAAESGAVSARDTESWLRLGVGNALITFGACRPLPAAQRQLADRAR